MRSGSAGRPVAPVAGWQEGAEPGSCLCISGSKQREVVGMVRKVPFLLCAGQREDLPCLVILKLKSKVSQTPFELP